MERRMRALARGTYLLNLLDAAFTLRALSLGASEGNPLMAAPLWMLGYKLLGVGAALAWLARRTEPLARRGLALLCALYAALLAYHLCWAAIL